jgi:hypothetical protein
MNIVFIILLALAFLLFAGQVANLLSMPGSDASNHSLCQSIGILLSIGLWLLLAVLLSIAKTKGAFPPLSGWLVFFALPASFAAMIAAVNLFESGFNGRWLVVPVAVSPFLIGLFAAALWFPSLRSHVELSAVNVGVWGSILVFSTVPWLCTLKQFRLNAERERKLEIQQETMEQMRRDRFDRLTPNSPLAEWLEFAAWGSDVRDRALTGIRQLPRRQAEAEAMLAGGDGVVLEMLPYLDLEATPALCQHARTFLCNYTRSFAKPQENPNSLALGIHRLERFDRPLKWLCQRRGDLSEAVDCLETFARLHPDTPERARFLAQVEDLRTER